MQPRSLISLPVYYCLFYTSAMLRLYFDILYSTNSVQMSIIANLNNSLHEKFPMCPSWSEGDNMSYTYQAEDRTKFLI